MVGTIVRIELVDWPIRQDLKATVRDAIGHATGDHSKVRWVLGLIHFLDVAKAENDIIGSTVTVFAGYAEACNGGTKRTQFDRDAVQLEGVTLYGFLIVAGDLDDFALLDRWNQWLVAHGASWMLSVSEVLADGFWPVVDCGPRLLFERLNQFKSSDSTAPRRYGQVDLGLLLPFWLQRCDKQNGYLCCALVRTSRIFDGNFR